MFGSKTLKQITDFWDWSLEVYDREGLSEKLIDLQDRFALDVNVILWCCWAGDAGFGVLPELSIRKAVDLSRHWGKDVVGPLRSARRALKTPPRQINNDAAQALREQVQAVELESERLQQAMLSQLAEDGGNGETLDAATAARRNLARYAALMNAAKLDGFSTGLLQNVVELAVPSVDER